MKAELPGVSRDSIDIQVQDNTLTMKSERKFEREVKEENYLRIERSYGAFQRVFNLPAGVQQDKIRATFKDGVLEVTMPKAEEAKPKQVKIDVKCLGSENLCLIGKSGGSRMGLTLRLNPCSR